MQLLTNRRHRVGVWMAKWLSKRTACSINAAAAVGPVAHLKSHLELFAGHWLCIRTCFAGSHLTVCTWHTLVRHPVRLLHSFIKSLLTNTAAGVVQISATALHQHQLSVHQHCNKRDEHDECRCCWSTVLAGVKVRLAVVTV